MPTVDQYIAWNRSASEKDQVAKLLQNACTIYSALYPQDARAKEVGAIGPTIALHRSVFQFGNETMFLKMAYGQLRKLLAGGLGGTALFKQVCALVRSCGLASFMLHQQLCWLHRTNMLGGAKNKPGVWRPHQLRGFSSWFFANVAGALSQWLTVSQKGGAASTADLLLAVRMSCDVVTSGFLCQRLAGATKLQSGICGFVSSALFAYTLSAKYKAKAATAKR